MAAGAHEHRYGRRYVRVRGGVPRPDWHKSGGADPRVDSAVDDAESSAVGDRLRATHRPADAPTPRPTIAPTHAPAHARPEARSRARRAKRPRAGEQLELVGIADAPVKRTWGGARRGAGRKKKRLAPGERPPIPHVPRPPHKDGNPVHVTFRARPGLPSFRTERVHRMLTSILSRQQKETKRPRKYSEHFQVVHFSIQSNHLHVMVEARNGTLRSGVSGLAIAFAKQLNKLLRRATGEVWAQRYHARELATPREVRNALAYIFHNWKKHGAITFGAIVDKHSSALRFEGWAEEVIGLYFAPKPDQPPWRPVEPRTWLLRVGWSRHHAKLLASERPA